MELPTPFTDDRGKIINIANAPVGSAVLITSKKGTTRANHWHRIDAHLCYVVSGQIEYYERPVPEPENLPPFVILAPHESSIPTSVTSASHITKHIFTAGEAFFTGSNVEHRMDFPMDTTFLTLGRLSRTPEEYEEDLVRIDVDLAALYREQEKSK